MTAARIRVATALLVREGRALLVHRRPSRSAFPDCWALAGGHVEPGELPYQAVGRECFEELGTQILQPRRVPMTVTHVNLDMHGFLVTRWTDEPFNAAPEEHDDMRWFSIGDIAALTLAHPESRPDIVNAIRLAANQPKHRQVELHPGRELS